jgi:hypothetical protein
MVDKERISKLQEGKGARKSMRLREWEQPWRVKPQGRDQHEIRLAGHGWSKALRACETLRRQRNPEAGNPGRYVAAQDRENVEG